MSWEQDNPVTYRFFLQWKDMIQWGSNYLNLLTDDDLLLPIAPGRNHALWVLGHLIESEDELSKYLGHGEMRFPEYETLFGMNSQLLTPDQYPSPKQLREQWVKVIHKNTRLFHAIRDAEWDEPHALIKGKPEDDFYGWKGRCIHLWIIHSHYHFGQIAILLATLKKSKY